MQHFNRTRCATATMDMTRYLLHRSIMPIAFVCIATLALAASAQEQTQEDILFGTWILQPGLSMYLNQDPPQSQIRVYKAHEEGIEAIITTVEANGVEQTSSYVADFDGEPHPVYGLENSDAISMERQDAYTTLSTFSHAGNVTGTAERRISTTGTTMTITVTINGQVILKAVYEKLIGE